MQRKSVRKRSSQTSTAGKQRSDTDEEILNLVRKGVEDFVLQKSTIQEFLRTLRKVTDREDSFPHPLTRTVFSRIVNEAIRKRELRLKQ